MKYEVKICIPRYKILYSLAFILILCVIHPVIYYSEIGGSIEEPAALLSVIFCADTYLTEVHNKRNDVFHLYSLKKQTKAIFQRLALQIVYVFGISCIGFFAFFWQRPVNLDKEITVPVMFGTFCIAMIVTISFWSILSTAVCTLFRNMWAGIGILFAFWVVLISNSGGTLLGKWSPFSYSFCEPVEILHWEWLSGKVVMVVMTMGLLYLIPMILKKRG